MYPTKRKDMKTANNPKSSYGDWQPNTKAQQKLYRKLGKVGNKTPYAKKHKKEYSYTVKDKEGYPQTEKMTVKQAKKKVSKNLKKTTKKKNIKEIDSAFKKISAGDPNLKLYQGKKKRAFNKTIKKRG